MSRTVALLDDPIFERHHAPYTHPEQPARLVAVRRALEESGLFEGQPRIQPAPAEIKRIEWVHEKAMIQRAEATAQQEYDQLDGDTYTSRDSYATALAAVGGLLESVRRVMEKEASQSVALVRPPGHHAEADRSMGFCMFNNVAIAAEFLRREYGLKRILIVDWDVHHGNGTQHSFYDTPEVFYFSTHQYPYYPGTGAMEETGVGKGEGYTLNAPMHAGEGDEAYLSAFLSVLEPVMEMYRPEYILISGGFDAHADDPLAGVQLTTAAFGQMAAVLDRIAQTYCEGRMTMTLEGGYDLKALADGVHSVCRVMRGVDRSQPPDAAEAPRHPRWERLAKAHADRWTVLR